MYSQPVFSTTAGSSTVLYAVRNRFVHPSGERVLYLQELEIITGFLESFTFLSSRVIAA